MSICLVQKIFFNYVLPSCLHKSVTLDELRTAQNHLAALLEYDDIAAAVAVLRRPEMLKYR